VKKKRVSEDEFMKYLKETTLGPISNEIAKNFIQIL